MHRTVLYVHGQGGSAAESERYKPLFPDDTVVGLDHGETPWEAGKEIAAAVDALGERGIVLIANSIGAYFSMCAGIDGRLERAYFISPVVDMERLILDLMQSAGVTEEELRRAGKIPTAFAPLEWDYLVYAREHPVVWRVPTRVLYGSRDDLTSYETIKAFADRCGADLTVMEGGEHWFHTKEQMRFLDDWIKRGEKK